jgi:hypothetical protein
MKFLKDPHSWAVLALILPELVPQIKDVLPDGAEKIVLLLIAAFVLYMNRYNNQQAAAAALAGYHSGHVYDDSEDEEFSDSDQEATEEKSYKAGFETKPVPDQPQKPFLRDGKCEHCGTIPPCMHHEDGEGVERP